MINNLPSEIVLKICHHVDFEEVYQLAWTNRKMMSIVRRNVPMALMPVLDMSSINISPISHKNNIYLIKADFTFAISYDSVAVIVQIRDHKEIKSSENEDLKNIRDFHKYYRYRRDLELKDQSVESWEFYVANNGNVPVLELRWFFAKTNIDGISINRCDRYQLWKLLDAIDSTCVNIRRKSLECGKYLQFELEDVAKIGKSKFMQNGISYIRVETCPHPIETLNIPNLKDTSWSICKLDNENLMNKLIQAASGYVSVDKGKIKIFEFIEASDKNQSRNFKNFLRFSKIKTNEFYMSDIRNVEGVWSWDAFNTMLDGLKKDEITYTVSDQSDENNPQLVSKSYRIKTPNKEWSISLELETDQLDDPEISPKFQITINDQTREEPEQDQQPQEQQQNQDEAPQPEQGQEQGQENQEQRNIQPEHNQNQPREDEIIVERLQQQNENEQAPNENRFLDYFLQVITFLSRN
ncbi:hypothetical protein WR25_06817 [Diploscapter pachys]|uniref:F-box domain-containing protein n=1 Tax=Diploscapter pachys TaxID=2018661 RepID=A0A2A2LN20_9BILA|nr:hypothetical protein WR25_06817 [Diploscapter pachys]